MIVDFLPKWLNCPLITGEVTIWGHHLVGPSPPCWLRNWCCPITCSHLVHSCTPPVSWPHLVGSYIHYVHLTRSCIYSTLLGGHTLLAPPLKLPNYSATPCQLLNSCFPVTWSYLIGSSIQVTQLDGHTTMAPEFSLPVIWHTYLAPTFRSC